MNQSSDDSRVGRGGAKRFIAIALVLFVPLGLVTFIAWRAFAPGTDPLLEAERSLGRLVGSTDSGEREELVASILAIAGRHDTVPGAIGDRARFLLTVGRYADGEGSERGLDGVDLAVIDARVLHDGAMMLFRSRAFRSADEAIESALTHTVEPETAEQTGIRVAILRAAIVIRFDIGRDEDVLDHCSELAKLVPDDATPFEAAALVHRNRGHWEHYVDSQRRAVELTGDDGPRLLELAEGLVELGQTVEAREAFDTVKRVHPELLAHRPLIEPNLLLLEGRGDEAGELLDEHATRHPDDTEGLLLRGRLLVERREFEAAVELFEQVIERDSSNQDAHFRLGQALARLGEEERARKHLDLHRAILDAKVRMHAMELTAAREPRNVEVRRQLATEYAKLGLSELADFWTRSAEAAAP